MNKNLRSFDMVQYFTKGKEKSRRAAFNPVMYCIGQWLSKWVLDVVPGGPQQKGE